MELLEMQPHIYGRDSSLAVMVDWASAGIYDGFRLSEWAQPNGHHALHDPQLNFKGDAYAFCIDDLELFLNKTIRIPIDQVLRLDSKSCLVSRDFITCRVQKSGDNNTKRQHTQPQSCGTVPCDEHNEHL
jgi:hypothetical protein